MLNSGLWILQSSSSVLLCVCVVAARLAWLFFFFSSTFLASSVGAIGTSFPFEVAEWFFSIAVEWIALWGCCEAANGRRLLGSVQQGDLVFFSLLIAVQRWWPLCRSFCFCVLLRTAEVLLVLLLERSTIQSGEPDVRRCGATSQLALWRRSRVLQRRCSSKVVAVVRGERDRERSGWAGAVAKGG